MIKVNFYHINCKTIIVIPLKKRYSLSVVSYILLKRTSTSRILHMIKRNYHFVQDLEYTPGQVNFIGSIYIPREQLKNSFNLDNIGIGDFIHLERMCNILEDPDNFV